MLDNTVTFAVDHDRDDTATNEPFTRVDAYDTGRSVYEGADSTLSARNMISCSRKRPVKSGNFRGVAKSSVKVTQDYEVEGVDSATVLTAPGIIAISASLPVGITPAEAMHLRQRAIATLEHQDFITRLTEGMEY